MSISMLAADRNAASTFFPRRGDESHSAATGFTDALARQAMTVDRAPGSVDAIVDGLPGGPTPVIDDLPGGPTPVIEGLPVERNPLLPPPGDDGNVDPMILLMHRLALSMLNTPAFSGVAVDPVLDR